MSVTVFIRHFVSYLSFSPDFSCFEAGPYCVARVEPELMILYVCLLSVGVRGVCTTQAWLPLLLWDVIGSV